MRVMIAGDTHGDADWCMSLTKLAARCGAQFVLQVGDFGYWPRMTTRSGRPQADHLLETIDIACRRFGVDGWIVIDGNHDDHQALAELMYAQDPDELGLYDLSGNVRYSPRANVFELGGITIGTLGGAVSIDALLEQHGVEFPGDHRYKPGWDWFPNIEAPSIAEAEALVKKGSIDILLTHEAPQWSNLALANKGLKLFIPPEIEDKARWVRALVTTVANACQPKLFVHGHWHQRYSSEYTIYGDIACRIEGLAHNGMGSGRDGRAFIYVDLPDLAVTDGRHGQRLLNSRSA